MKKILLIGKYGQIGWELQRTLAPLGKIIAFGREEFDLAAHENIRNIIEDCHPDVIVNAGGYTDVEKAEQERELAIQINSVAPGILAEEAKKINALLIHYSTDYVFDGQSKVPYKEDDEPHPLNFYGETKWAGEKAIETFGGRYLIFRTSWAYGMRGSNFLRTMLNVANRGQELKIVNDQVGAPTWRRLIAEATAQVIAQGKSISGIYHLSSAGSTTWYSFAEAIFRGSEHLAPIASSQYHSKVIRPSYSVLSNAKVQRDFGIYLPDWQEGLDLCLER